MLSRAISNFLKTPLLVALARSRLCGAPLAVRVGGGGALSVQLAHLADVRGLLHDLTDASQPRFGELVAQTLDRRRREEDTVNWSFVLKYLLDTNTKLRGGAVWLFRHAGLC